MEKHGVTFKDYACASANMAAGMSTEDVCKVLGVELPVWDKVVESFNNEMASLEPGGEEMTFYCTVFTNPKQGKFANVEGAAGGKEEVVAKYPEWSDFIKIQQHIAAASDNGIEVDLEKEYDISLTEFSQLGAHWSAHYKEKVIDVVDYDSFAFEHKGGSAITPEQEERIRVFEQHSDLMDNWISHFKEVYKDAGAGLSDDIDF